MITPFVAHGSLLSVRRLIRNPHLTDDLFREFVSDHIHELSVDDLLVALWHPACPPEVLAVFKDYPCEVGIVARERINLNNRYFLSYFTGEFDERMFDALGEVHPHSVRALVRVMLDTVEIEPW